MFLKNMLNTIYFVLISYLYAFRSYFLPKKFQKHKNVYKKNVLITGAGSGIGRELAKSFAKKGAFLLLWDISFNLCKETEKMCKLLGAKTFSQYVDVSSRENIYSAIEQIPKETKNLMNPDNIDIVINNAGIICEGNFLEQNDEKIEKLIQINFFQTVWTTKAFLPKMLKRNEGGHIVVVASVAAFIGAPEMAAYSASKSALCALIEEIENEVTNPNIHFTRILPHFVKTPLIKNCKLAKQFKNQLTVQEVVSQIISGIEENKKIVFIPKKLSILYALKGLLPCNLFNYLALNIKRPY